MKTRTILTILIATLIVTFLIKRTSDYLIQEWLISFTKQPGISVSYDSFSVNLPDAHTEKLEITIIRPGVFLTLIIDRIDLHLKLSSLLEKSPLIEFYASLYDGVVTGELEYPDFSAQPELKLQISKVSLEQIPQLAAFGIKEIQLDVPELNFSNSEQSGNIKLLISKINKQTAMLPIPKRIKNLQISSGKIGFEASVKAKQLKLSRYRITDKNMSLSGKGKALINNNRIKNYALTGKFSSERDWIKENFPELADSCPYNNLELLVKSNKPHFQVTKPDGLLCFPRQNTRNLSPTVSVE